MRKKIFITELVIFILIVTGILPRSISLVLAAGLALGAILLPLEEAVLLFISSIPLFLALPLTATFDNFNTWRVISLIIFVRWLLQRETLTILREHIALVMRRHTRWHLEHPVITALLVVLLLAILSTVVSSDSTLAIKRIIYFLNLSFIGVVLYNLASRNQSLIPRTIVAIALPTITVIVVGFIQLASTYALDIYQFVGIWGEGIQLRQFGTVWASIVAEVGNTWFAYYGDQLSLRVFSLFPDSHSFPQFVLLGVPAILALSLGHIITATTVVSQMIRRRARFLIVWVPLGFLIAILSGTRGIWAASIGVVGGAFLLLWKLKKSADHRHTQVFKYLALYLVLFFFLFTVAYPIFVSPQFLVAKGNFLLFGDRLKSILNFGETSNALRILIWKASLTSIVQHPLLGIGIGNFPVVLGEDLFLARAGSSAHNIYLQIAAEMGIPALCLVLWLMWQLLATTYRSYLKENDPILLVYYGSALLYVPWIFLYSLTDVALFDERAFLLFVTTVALVAAHHE
ncbi:MAG: O-antigen ligase family protein [Patescibacteria group bacterium]